ncbi:uncharacterized protein BT62DRAFT_932619 [Guyanagaster necrorhizus]|uniref:BTB domain-containing protein n=1 Tax=Guyanagaster necrorhizus TaxID=856835 RepID=A0A9P7VRE2_9AGAR|nr:uncharacterized protein BT62DRAFT_932619 [Guyanagaster necrorhizus MCA 3950]KAG7445524.1 hypothetical protein BT62DRAFT_932619 [Guyanagaster necrorhizus MCA 3950]
MSPPSQSVMLDLDDFEGPPNIDDDDDEFPSVSELSQMVEGTRPRFTKADTPQPSISVPLASTPRRSQSQNSSTEVPRTPSHGIISTSSSPTTPPKNLSQINKPGTQKRKQDDGDRSITASQQPAKRQKVKAARRLVMHKHQVHWELDGNVVVRIKKTLFRLHRSIARYSEWFSKRIEGGADDFEGKDPIYDIDDKVTEEDFEALLDAMDDAITYFYNPPDFFTAASIFRASSALSFNRFRDWATRYLEEMWPSSLSKVTTTPINHASATVILARECGLKSIRKRALYELVRLTGFGQDDSDDETDHHHHHHQPSSSRSSRTAISSSDYRLLVRAREMLTSAWTTRIATATFGVEGKCVGNVSGCTASEVGLVAAKHQEMVGASGLFETFLRDPICGTQALMELDWAKAGGYCQGCVDQRIVVWRKARERMWEDLDIWLGLDKC